MAAPEVNGFGVRTFTPGLSRSAQVWMCFGLPLRTTKATTEVVTSPLFGPAFQSAETMPGSTRRVMSGSTEKLDDVGLLTGLDGAALIAGRAEGGLEAEPLPAAVLLNAGMIWS